MKIVYENGFTGRNVTPRDQLAIFREDMISGSNETHNLESGCNESRGNENAAVASRGDADANGQFPFMSLSEVS